MSNDYDELPTCTDEDGHAWQPVPGTVFVDACATCGLTVKDGWVKLTPAQRRRLVHKRNRSLRVRPEPTGAA